MTFEISLENLVASLPYMGIGMLGIFIVTCIIVVVVTLLNKLTNKKK